MLQPSPVSIEDTVGVHGVTNYSHAFARLRESFPTITWFNADETQIPDGVASIRLATDPGQPEGGFTITVDTQESAPSIAISSGPFSGAIYGVEELIQRRTT